MSDLAFLQEGPGKPQSILTNAAPARPVRKNKRNKGTRHAFVPLIYSVSHLSRGSRSNDSDTA